MAPRLRVATRGSDLARRQTDSVVARLGIEVDVVVVSTTGDRRTDVPIHSLGGTGVFVKEVQEAVLAGDADFAVHSAKDLPSQPTTGLTIAAVPERGDPRDALVGSTLAGLALGARVGTGAVRRRAQLAHARPDLTFGEIRGNIATRLDRSADFNAVVVAAVALERLGLTGRIAERLGVDVVLPQVGQGAIAVECRSDDGSTLSALAAVDDVVAHTAVTAERAFLAHLGGGCDLPVGAYARVGPDGATTLDVLLASLDGVTVVRASCVGADPVSTGDEAARRLLDDAGGRALLEEVA
ncbi:MAG: hydroxymethylbilane synthase [Actinomycetes bacterium]